MLLSVRHAAQRLDIHPDTLRRWAREGRIRNLEKAGALIAAEIDRLQRKGGNEG